GLLGKWFFGKIYDSPLVAVHISIALVMGGYALSSVLHVSGALAMVVLGLMIGNYLHRSCQSKEMIENMSVFWRVLDEILNAILFVLIGIEIISLDFQNIFLLLAAIAVPLVLLARFTAIALSNIFLKSNHRSGIPQISVLTWAGLRGGISIALALSLPENDFREVIIFITYSVVVFSILIQGLSIDKLVSKILIKTDRNEG
ncbi:MAG: cation:proton antiporter, partial [Flavobacteriaceae bacterium]